ncbi:hypothetical protein MUK42_35211 [Musa troglodytarum]|uniref:Uncharacterized protein n=1 Tax=Musa troglodytarum TaxID=320322 RepID=A0A9E7EDQ2_9LILI|nr:hypothetical protein MUK42_35211 [Musa troglodytarum]
MAAGTAALRKLCVLARCSSFFVRSETLEVGGSGGFGGSEILKAHEVGLSTTQVHRIHTVL